MPWKLNGDALATDEDGMPIWIDEPKKRQPRRKKVTEEKK